MGKPFTCGQCGQSFEVPEAALKKYPGWTPRVCMACRDASPKRGRSKTKTKSSGKAKKKIGEDYAVGM